MNTVTPRANPADARRGRSIKNRCIEFATLAMLGKLGRCLLPATTVLLQACVLVPVTTEIYDADCGVTAKQMELAPVQIAGIHGCSNQGCIALLIAGGVTAAASAIISGTIVVVGNVVYWFEKQGRCKTVSGSHPP